MQKRQREKVEDVSRRQLDWISRHGYDLFLSITVFAVGNAAQPSTKNRWITGLNIEAVTHTHILMQHDSNMWSGRNPYNGSTESHGAQVRRHEAWNVLWKSRNDATSMFLSFFFFSRGTIVHIRTDKSWDENLLLCISGPSVMIQHPTQRHTNTCTHILLLEKRKSVSQVFSSVPLRCLALGQSQPHH